MFEVPQEKIGVSSKQSPKPVTTMQSTILLLINLTNHARIQQAARARKLKQNRAAGIGDENGRMPARVKAAAQMSKCVECANGVQDYQNQYSLYGTEAACRKQAREDGGGLLSRSGKDLRRTGERHQGWERGQDRRR